VDAAQDQGDEYTYGKCHFYPSQLLYDSHREYYRIQE